MSLFSSLFFKEHSNTVTATGPHQPPEHRDNGMMILCHENILALNALLVVFCKVGVKLLSCMFAFLYE